MPKKSNTDPKPQCVQTDVSGIPRTKISTLSCPNLTNNRRDGNTTRQVNYGIDELFKGSNVLFSDHFENGQNKNANRNLWLQVLERLKTEHDIIHLKKFFEFDTLNNCINHIN